MSAALWLALVASLPVEPLLPGSPAVIRGHTDAITALAVSADGHRVATASRDGSIRVWSLDDGKELASVPTDGKSQVNAIAFSPDGTLLATGNVDLQVRLLDVATGAVKRVTAFPDAVFEVGFRPDGRELAVAGASGQTLVLTVADGTWAKSELPGRSARYSADGKLLVLGSRGGGLAVADPVSHQVKKNIATGSHLPLVAVSADGSLIASWNAKERDVHLWQVKTAKKVGWPCLRRRVRRRSESHRDSARHDAVGRHGGDRCGRPAVARVDGGHQDRGDELAPGATGGLGRRHSR